MSSPRPLSFLFSQSGALVRRIASVSRRRFLFGALAIFAIGGMAVLSQEASLDEKLNVEYGTAAGQKLQLDIFRPKGIKAPRPMVICVHGGGWTSGNRKDFHLLARALAHAGYVAVCPSYRLVKNGTNNHPAQIDDVQRAVRWMRAHAQELQGDPNRVGAIGASAGGHLVSLLGTTDTRANSDKALAGHSSRVNCVVDVCGPSDLTKDFSSMKFGEITIQSIVDGLIGKRQTEDPKPFREASPIFHIDAKTAPFLIFHGTVDNIVPLEQSQILHAALQKAGVESKLITFDGEGHAFTKKENIETMLKEAVAFFKHHLKP